MVEMLDQFSRDPTLETFAYVDRADGRLFFGRGKVRHTFGPNTPNKERGLNAEINGMKYGVIWGPDKVSAEKTLETLKFEQKHGLS